MKRPWSGSRPAPLRWTERGLRIAEHAGAGAWMGGAFGIALVLAVLVLAALGPGKDGTATALRLTARWSFLFFWPAYAGGALAVLFGPRFAILARHGRDFGLAFAAAQLVHLSLVVWIGWISHQPLVEAAMPFFAFGIVWVYVLALLSVERIGNLFSRGLQRILRNVGMEYIALVFFADFIIGPIQSKFSKPILYVPFAVPLIAAPLLRIAALVRRSGLGARAFRLRLARPAWREPDRGRRPERGPRRT